MRIQKIYWNIIKYIKHTFDNKFNFLFEKNNHDLII